MRPATFGVVALIACAPKPPALEPPVEPVAVVVATPTPAPTPSPVVLAETASPDEACGAIPLPGVYSTDRLTLRHPAAWRRDPIAGLVADGRQVVVSVYAVGDPATRARDAIREHKRFGNSFREQKVDGRFAASWWTRDATPIPEIAPRALPDSISFYVAIALDERTVAEVRGRALVTARQDVFCEIRAILGSAAIR